MEQKTTQTPPQINNGGQPQPKKKKRTWLYILLGLLALGFIANMCDNDTAKTDENQNVEAKDEPKSDEKAEPKIDSIKAKELAPLFTHRVDEFSKKEWVEPKSAPKYRNRNGVYAYFEIADGKPCNLRLVGQYYADDWLFIKKCIFLIDGEACPIVTSAERDNEGGKIWEWFDLPVNRQDVYIAFASMLKAKEVKVRYEGRQYHDDRKLTENELKAIKNTYDYYIALGGE